MIERFYADLHIHSRYSRATSRDGTLDQLAFWAAKKGISVLGTGDFTHPGWMNDIRGRLVPAEPGLFRLKDEFDKDVESQWRRLHPPHKARAGRSNRADAERQVTRFMLQVEISTIYKKGDRTRKVHHLVYAPDLKTAEEITRRLARIGNLASDGRPILGLDSRHLLEIVLESGDGTFLVPAHIWTPWFSVLGSKSGFDTLAECYGDLASHVFAAETGLSSDPAMNWRLSALDRYRLMSNSDAHSPAKLGREACVFETDLDYFAMRTALETGRGYGGTVEFFPEEGKYHLDGHRECGVRLSPEETKKLKGVCPVCGKGVTVGVLNRVDELADRPEGARADGAAPFRSFIPLGEVLGEIAGVGAGSRRVQESYDGLIAGLGPELFILEHAPAEAIRKAGSPALAEAIERMRKGRVIRQAGYDGEYGVIRVFEEGELKGEKSAGLLFETKEKGEEPQNRRMANRRITKSGSATEAGKEPARVRERPAAGEEKTGTGILEGLDEDQRRAAEKTDGALLIVAGPGTGKTRTLTHRIAHIVTDRGIAPENCLAITFTRRAAGEMQERLNRLMPDKTGRIPVMTFHGLGHSLLREYGSLMDLPGDFRVAEEHERIGLLAEAAGLTRPRARKLLAEWSNLRRKGGRGEGGLELDPAVRAYAAAKMKRGWLDYDDLIALATELLESQPEISALYRTRYRWVSIDEYQDIDDPQYRLVKALVPPDGNLCAIGDPDQAIYGFRGTDVRFFRQFTADFPGAEIVRLKRNYRSGKAIVKAALQVMAVAGTDEKRVLKALVEDRARIEIHESSTDWAEAQFVAKTVEKLVGGTTFLALDSRRVKGDGAPDFAFSDFAVLYRTDEQSAILCETLARAGIPFQKRTHRRLMESEAVTAVAEAMRRLKGGEGAAACLDEAMAGVRQQAEGEDVTPVLRRLAEKAGSVDEFLALLATGTDVDLLDPRAECVSLLTLHAAKGLEFSVVFMVGCEDGLLPLRWGGEEEGDVEEERRLFFVGMTRARSRLFLCHSRKRRWRGKEREMMASPFLRDIEEALLERSRSEKRKAKPAVTVEQLDLF